LASPAQGRVAVGDAEGSEEHDTRRVSTARSVGRGLVAGRSHRVVVIVGKAVGEETVAPRNGAAIEADAVFGKAKGSPVRANGSCGRDG